MAGANFSGSWIRTASLMGMVTVEGEGLPGITVSISGRQEAQMLTDDNGQYTFTGLRAGNYTVEIMGFDATDVGFSATSSAIEVAVGESKVWSFDGTYVRESTIAGQVSVEGNGLSDVTVSLQGMGADESAMTDVGGQFTFSNLRAGEYQLAISGFDTNEYGFSTTSATVRVEHGRTANVPFEGIMLRTAAIMGQVSIEGEGLADVTVSLSGEGESLTTMTDMSGQYSFSDLPAGNFQVGISGYDTDDFSFETTSKNVALALGETATVPFEGILLRTSGISGRVSVEGTGLGDVTVTLSGDDLDEDMEVMTDASGQYAIAGLAEGDYTVAISGYDDVSYIFETTSMDVTLGEDDTQIINFMGMHARTASVTVQMFVDEAGNNDAYDEGEHKFPSAEMIQMVAAAGLPLPLDQIVSLAGPGVHDMQPGTTMPDGKVVFSGLRAGQYQLIVSDLPAQVLALLPPQLAHVLRDYAYGGPAQGYPMALTVGQEEERHVPIDITHTTVNFGVTLKHGDKTGAPLEGATVTLYSDAAGTLKIADAMTNATGMTSIRIARAGTTGNAVHAAVAAPAGSYHTSGTMQAVPWNPQYPATVATNDADIVNTMVSFSFSGATVDRGDYGGGNALGGWAVSVTSGDEAVDGAPGKLGADGSASHSEAVAAGDLPKSYEIAMVGWEDQPDDTLTGDGGERFTSTTLSHTHDGLSLAGTSTDAGSLEVTYTTQRVRVYVHQENDQVMGFTGNVLGGDMRMGGIVDVDIEHIASNGRASNFEATDSVKSSAGGGLYQFWNVPAGANVIITADEIPTLGKDEDDNDIANTNRLLKKYGHSDELAAYTDVEANGIMGGLFGANGGFHHTVDLCPLMSDEGDQRHGECSSFAFVETFAVNGQAWKNVVSKSTDDFRTDVDGDVVISKAGVKDLSVSMDPVDGENLAGDQETFTDENGRTLLFDFGHMASGVYTVTAPNHWIAQRGPLEDPTDDLDDYLTPLDTTLNIDVTPKTGYAYGTVTDNENRRLAGVTVNVNGVSVETDSQGRYVAEDFYARNYRAPGSRTTQRNRIVVTTAEEGSQETTDLGSFAANTPRRVDVEIEDATEVTTINGRVTHSDGGAGVGGVRVWVDGSAPINKNARSSSRLTLNNIYITDSNGNFSVRIHSKDGGASAVVTVSRDGMFFSPDQHTVSAVAGAEISGINFTAFDNGTIHGRVVDEDDEPIGGVLVTAAQVGGTAMDTMTTSAATGAYSLSVRYGQYGVSAAKNGYTFSDTTGVNVPNDGKALNDLVGTPDEANADLGSLSLSGVGLCRANTAACATASRGFRSATTAYYATVGNSLAMTTVRATAAVSGNSVDIYPGDADSNTDGHQVALEVGENMIEVEVTAADGETTKMYTATVTRRAESTIITGTITDTELDEDGNTVGVASVQIRVGGGTLIGGDRYNSRGGYVTTNASGEYKAEVESTGNAGTVTPSKTSYTFEPGSRAVTLNSGAVSGIDFTGSSYATITGRVMVGTDGLEGATVTGTSTGGGTPGSATTDRRGNFRFTVASGTVTVTIAKTGYSFPNQTIFVGAGESRSLGNITAEGNMAPLNVTAERDTADTGLFEATVTVEWTPGPGGRATQYQVQIQDTLGMWQDVEAAVTAPTADNDPADADSTWQAQITPPTGGDSSDPEGELEIRVMAQHDHDADDQTDMQEYASDAVTVDAIDPTADDVAARRNVDAEPDSLVVTWTADGNTNSEWRVVVSFDSGTTWYVLNDATGAGGSWGAEVDNIVGTTPTTATNDGSAGTAKAAAVTAAEVDGALMFRVDARQGAVGEDNQWKVGPTASVLAKN